MLMIVAVLFIGNPHYFKDYGKIVITFKNQNQNILFALETGSLIQYILVIKPNGVQYIK